ncbi:hypothetical protein X768_30620 [Mesorhizobium sp. LSJC265A00]|nr:hypothetical protein X768_30620 [Mesorhizobium sp. LSJC265A00]
MMRKLAIVLVSMMALCPWGDLMAQDGVSVKTLPEQAGSGDPVTLNLAVGGGLRQISVLRSAQDEALYQGDIILGPMANLASLADGTNLMSLSEPVLFGLGARDEKLRWPGEVMRYRIDASLKDKQRVYSALAAWEDAAQVKFEEIAKPEGNYVEFVAGDGCSSSVGMIGGRQVINLADSCSTGNAMHEIGHALGLHHEQAREDRGQHVVVLEENIISFYKGNFRRDPVNFEDVGQYCYGSLMHYGPYAFSKSPDVLKTIETVPEGIEIGQRSYIADCDVDAVRTLYTNGGIAMDPPKVGFEGKLELFPEGCRDHGLCYLKNDIYFTDKSNVRWKAPARNAAWGAAVHSGSTDGASIPKWAQAVVGQPFDEQYLMAAALHDHYCYKENLVRPWRQTHRMFYDAMVALKVPAVKAKTMYAAVYLGGPKWVELVPGESCGKNCIFDAAGGPEKLVETGGKVWLYREAENDPETGRKFENLKATIEQFPDISLSEVEALSNAFDHDVFADRGASVVPQDAADLAFISK